MTDLTPPEGQPKERVIELDEWFTPFENYDDIPYDNKPTPATAYVDPNGENSREKIVYFELANIGRFRVSVWWDEELVDPELAEEEKYLLVLPTSEKLIGGGEMKAEQEKMETRPMEIYIGFKDEGLRGKYLPYRVELKLPSGSIASAVIGPAIVPTDLPSSHDMWSIDDEEINGVLIPETQSLISKLQLRFVSKE